MFICTAIIINSNDYLTLRLFPFVLSLPENPQSTVHLAHGTKLIYRKYSNTYLGNMTHSEVLIYEWHLN